MIRFEDAKGDGPLWAEMRDAGLVDPAAIDRIDAILGRPESCTLDQVLLGGAEVIADAAWLSWLIRRHGCHRFGRVTRCGPPEAWPRDDPLAEGNLPYRRCAEPGHWLVAVMRPDRWGCTERRHAGLTLLPAAATLPELRELRRTCLRLQPGGQSLV